MKAHFGGDFIHEYDPWFDSGLLNEIEIARLYSLLGKNLKVMNACSSEISESDNEDENLFDVRVYTAGVAGLYGIMGSILMLDNVGRMWVAFTDGAVIRYFTNVLDNKNLLPNTIEKWCNSVEGVEIVYSDMVETIPSWVS